MDWQPIETAPKDGTAILAYSADAAADGRPYPMLIVAWGMPWEWTIFSEDGTTQTGTDYEPTHWMPLPAAPVSA